MISIERYSEWLNKSKVLEYVSERTEGNITEITIRGRDGKLWCRTFIDGISKGRNQFKSI